VVPPVLQNQSRPVLSAYRSPCWPPFGWGRVRARQELDLGGGTVEHPAPALGAVAPDAGSGAQPLAEHADPGSVDGPVDGPSRPGVGAPDPDPIAAGAEILPFHRRRERPRAVGVQRAEDRDGVAGGALTGPGDRRARTVGAQDAEDVRGGRIPAHASPGAVRADESAVAAHHAIATTVVGEAEYAIWYAPGARSGPSAGSPFRPPGRILARVPRPGRTGNGQEPPHPAARLPPRRLSRRRQPWSRP
jgi:hypothetical protein